MQLKKLEIQGFKSFADKTEILFLDGITTIVGPNGSGKSNISDAIRWVIGEQSAKNLRGTKMEDVIFAGTEARKKVGFAEVSMYLDNSDGTLPIDYSEVIVTRRVYRSGESNYLINGNECRLKDIQAIFMDTGLGKDGYSIDWIILWQCIWMGLTLLLPPKTKCFMESFIKENCRMEDFQ